MPYLNVDITEAIYRSIKVRAAETGTSLRVMVEHALTIYLNHGAPPALGDPDVVRVDRSRPVIAIPKAQSARKAKKA